MSACNLRKKSNFVILIPFLIDLLNKSKSATIYSEIRKNLQGWSTNRFVEIWPSKKNETLSSEMSPRNFSDEW